MLTENILADIDARLENFKPEDIKSLIQAEGNATEGGLEFVLKDLPTTDPTLQMIINDPHFEIRPIGNQTKSGEMYFDLIGAERQVRVKVICRTAKEDENA